MIDQPVWKEPAHVFHCPIVVGRGASIAAFNTWTALKLSQTNNWSSVYTRVVYFPAYISAEARLPHCFPSPSAASIYSALHRVV